MMTLLELYTRPWDPAEPVIWLDEKLVQVLEDLHGPYPITSHHERQEDYQYQQNGMANIFVAVAPKSGWRYLEITERRTNTDFAQFIRTLVTAHPEASVLHLVLDNLSIHTREALLQKYLGYKSCTAPRAVSNSDTGQKSLLTHLTSSCFTRYPFFI